MLKTHIAFCIDESGSVARIVKHLVKAYNKNMDDIRKSVIDHGQEATMTALAFGDQVVHHRILYAGQQVQTVKELKVSDLNPSGMTPLFDSVYRAIKKLEELDDKEANTAFIITVVTDGAENDSKDPGVPEVLKEIQAKTATDRWSFTFLVPNGAKKQFCWRYDIPAGNVQEWDAQSEEGTIRAFDITAKAYDGYFASRSSGIRSTRSFYSDIGDLTVRKARTSLSKITGQVEIIIAKKDTLIRDCVVDAGFTYIKGAAFYELVKTEKKVQPYKMVALKVLSSGEVYSGTEAREMLGINTNQTVRLVPGDHGKFQVFVQSTSYTRKIPKGSAVLYWPKFGQQQK